MIKCCWYVNSVRRSVEIMVGVAMMVGSVSERKRKRKSGGRKINRGDIFPSRFVIAVLWCATARLLLTLELAVGRHQR